MSAAADIVVEPPSFSAGISIGGRSSSSGKEGSKKQTSAQKAVLITDKLSPEQRADEVLFHGPKEENVRVDVGHDSTSQGELVSAPWSADGKVSDLYMMKGGKFEENIIKVVGSKADVQSTKALTDFGKLGGYIENLVESDQELKRLHALHIVKESKTVNFESILQKMGPDETLVGKVACKALINAPSTGYDIVSDLVLVMTRIRIDGVPGGYQRRLYFFHSVEHENLNGERKHVEGQSTTMKCGCVPFKDSANMTKEKVSAALQTSVYMDYLGVEDQIVQMFYQQVDGTKVDKMFEKGAAKHEQFDCCKLFCDCLCCRLKCCPQLCPDKSESKTSDYELSARTVKALQDIMFTEAKMKTSETGTDRFKSAVTEVQISNFNAIHLRWTDPLTLKIKETIAIISSSESVVNICSFVGLAARAPNQLHMLSSAGAAGGAGGALGGSSRPTLDFNPSKSAVDRFRNKAVFVSGSAPAPAQGSSQSAMSALGLDFLAQPFGQKPAAKGDDEEGEGGAK